MELDDALPSAPDEEDPPVPLKVTAADSDALVRDELDFDALALWSLVVDVLEVVEVEAEAPEDWSAVFVGLEADSRGLDALAEASPDADAVDADADADADVDALDPAGVEADAVEVAGAVGDEAAGVVVAGDAVA